MPELPEVEVTRRRIEPFLLGRRIASVSTTKDSYFFLTKPSSLRRGLAGRCVTELRRHGKYLLASLDDGNRLLVHLGMSGQLFTGDATSVRLLLASRLSSLTPEQQKKFKPDRHTHLRLRFEDGGPAVFLRDVRKFGKVRLLGPDQPEPRLTSSCVTARTTSGPVMCMYEVPATMQMKSVIAGL